jgi:hypothetical protein
MARLIPADTSDTLDLEAFVERVDADVDFDDPAALPGAAKLLRMLANDRRFLARHIAAEIAAGAFQPGNQATAATFHLATRPRFIVRANVWLPLRGTEVARAAQERLFFYDVPHDHDFDFLTVGYHGPGYETDLWEYDETDLWEYDRAALEGRPGEPARLAPCGRARLERGAVMHFRAHVDVHAQRPPEALSISVNLVSRVRRASWSQLLFDVERGVVSSPVDGAAGARALVHAAADLLGVAARDHLPGRTARFGEVSP